MTDGNGKGPKAQVVGKVIPAPTGPFSGRGEHAHTPVVQEFTEFKIGGDPEMNEEQVRLGFKVPVSNLPGADMTNYRFLLCSECGMVYWEIFEDAST